MTKKKITLHDISKESGFSITTISHLLNKTRHVDESTGKIIYDTINKLGGYEISPVQQNRRKNIAFVVGSLKVDFFNEMIQDVTDTALQNGYSLLLAESAESEEKEKDYIKMFEANNIKGLIIAPSDYQNDISSWLQTDIPVVLIDRDINNSNYDFVGIDNFKSAYEATQLLIKYGAKNLGFVGRDIKNYNTSERKRGFEVALHEAGLYTTNHTFFLNSCIDSPQNFYTEYQNFIRGENPKDGIVCVDNNVCFELLAFLEKLDINVPDDILIVSFDDNKWFRFTKAPISAIDQPTGEIAVLATELLISKIQARKKRSLKPASNINVRQTILLDYTLIDRFKGIKNHSK